MVLFLVSVLVNYNNPGFEKHNGESMMPESHFWLSYHFKANITAIKCYKIYAKNIFIHCINTIFFIQQAMKD